MGNVIAFVGRSLPRGGFNGQLVRALAVALIAMCILVETGAAKPYSIGNASQNGFVAACQYNGGTTRRLSTRVVECTLPNGYVIVCNFNSGLCVDYPPAGIISVSDSSSNGSRSVVATGTWALLPGLAPSQPIHFANSTP